MQPLISVIVPVYQVEKYLDRCVESIVKQTYTHLEIILVDDGSPDESGAMCEHWAQKDSRVRVIHKENGGLSDARNAGLAAATGEYIGFVDSDDWVDPEFCRILLEQLEHTDCDIACCDAFSFYDDGELAPEGPFRQTQYDTVQALSALIDGTLRQVVWNKLYRRCVVEGIPFPVKKCHEDEFWSYQVIARARKIAHTSFYGYHYFQRPDSIMGRQYTLRNLDGLEAKLQRQMFLEARCPALAQKGRIDLNFFCMYHGQKVLTCLNGDDRRKALAYIKSVLRENRLTARDQKQLSVTHRIWYALLGICPKLTFRLRNWLHIGL